jgi:uncharacterized protein YhaN
MIIRKLQLQHFGKFSEAVFEFRRGLNLVVGPNEAGKSTMMEAIPAILFGLRDKARYRSWGRRGESIGSLILEQSGGALKIVRQIESNRVDLEELDSLYQSQNSFSGKVSPQGRSSEARVYSDILEENFGLSDEQLLRASLFFGQGQLEIPAHKNVPARIKAMISGFGTVDYDQVLHMLREDFFTLTRHNPWGKDKNRDRELELTQSSLEAARSQLDMLQSELGSSEGELSRDEALNDQRQQLAKEVASGESYLGWLTAYYALENQRNSLVQKHEAVKSDLQQNASLESQLAALDEELQGQDLTMVARPELMTAFSQRDRLESELQRIELEGRQVRNDLQNKVAQKLLWPTLATLALLSSLVAGYLLRPDWLAYLVGGTTTCSACIWLLVYRQRLMMRLEKESLRKQLAVLGARKRSTQAERLELKQSLAATGIISETAGSSGGDEKSSAAQLLLKRGELAGELKTRSSSAELEASYHELVRELAVIDARLDAQRAPVAGRDLAATELDAAKEQLLNKQQQLAELDLTRSRHAGLPNRTSTLRMEVAALIEKCQDLNERIVLLQQRVAALQLGHDVLQATVKDYREGALVRLADATAQKLKLLTSGRHSAIRFDDDLKPFLKANNGSWQPLDLFSSGTRDLVYLVLRLVFQEMIFPGRKLPLLLDDPFVNLDQDRRQKMLAVLEKLSLEHQIILFSHDRKLLGKAARDRWHVLPLDQQQSRTQFTEEDDHDGGQLHLL